MAPPRTEVDLDKVKELSSYMSLMGVSQEMGIGREVLRRLTKEHNLKFSRKHSTNLNKEEDLSYITNSERQFIKAKEELLDLSFDFIDEEAQSNSSDDFEKAKIELKNMSYKTNNKSILTKLGKLHLNTLQKQINDLKSSIKSSKKNIVECENKIEILKDLHTVVFKINKI